MQDTSSFSVDIKSQGYEGLIGIGPNTGSVIRDEIGEAIGGESPDRWLTIAFTTDPEWAD